MTLHPVDPRQEADRNCLDYPYPEDFYPVATGLLEAEPVLRLCNECPVREACLTFARTHKEWGIWGGRYLENGKVKALRTAAGRPSEDALVLV